MRETKAFASLSSGLLARKGQARPAMRPQGFAQGMVQTDDLGWNDMGHDVPRFAGVRLPAGLAGPQAVTTRPPVETPAALPEVLRQQDEIAREFAMPASSDEPTVGPEAIMPAEDIVAVEPPVTADVVAAPADPADGERAAAPAPVSRARRAAKARPPVAVPRETVRKAAFTLRLATDRHLLLRLACAVQNRSAQQIVTEALDRLLADLPDVARLAASLPRKD
jgi:hypothetical protein